MLSGEATGLKLAKILIFAIVSSCQRPAPFTSDFDTRCSANRLIQNNFLFIARIYRVLTDAERKSEHLQEAGHEMPVYGYARVSSGGQELDLQLDQLRAAGCAKVFREKQSGVKDDRAVLARMLSALRPGDTVIVTALDRLTRGGPYKMLSVLQDITGRGASYKSLAEPWADTTHELGEVLAALVGYIARKTREDIIRRTSAGRERARARGVKFGRPHKLSVAARTVALARREAGENVSLLAREYGVSAWTISRLTPG